MCDDSSTTRCHRGRIFPKCRLFRHGGHVCRDDILCGRWNQRHRGHYQYVSIYKKKNYIFIENRIKNRWHCVKDMLEDILEPRLQ